MTDPSGATPAAALLIAAAQQDPTPLQQLAARLRLPHPAGAAYASPEAWLIAHGQSFTGLSAAAKPPLARQLAPEATFTPSDCTSNALTLLSDAPVLRLVHGVAAWAGSDDLVAHAWCVTEDGVVVDPTWPTMAKTPHRYFGVVLPAEFVVGFYARQLTGSGAGYDQRATVDLFPMLSPELLAKPFFAPAAPRQIPASRSSRGG